MLKKLKQFILTLSWTNHTFSMKTIHSKTPKTTKFLVTCTKFKIKFIKVNVSGVVGFWFWSFDKPSFHPVLWKKINFNNNCLSMFFFSSWTLIFAVSTSICRRCESLQCGVDPLILLAPTHVISSSRERERSSCN